MLATGGRYVGTSEAGVVWASYEGDADFAAMCETFDEFYAPVVCIDYAYDTVLVPMR
jgi:hypothetical protein